MKQLVISMLVAAFVLSQGTAYAKLVGGKVVSTDVAASTVTISQTNPETVWNAFRLANFSIKQGDKVKIFLVGAGVEYEASGSEKLNIQEQAAEFLKSDNAEILACGTCLKLRKQEETTTCPMSTMKDLYTLVSECDKILTF